MKTPICIICRKKRQVEWNLCIKCLKTVSDKQRAKALQILTKEQGL